MTMSLGLGLDKSIKLKKNFISTWKTDYTSTGSSNSNQVKLPLISTGIYNFMVDWGDGQKDRITAYNQAEVTHTYTSISTYTIKISGVCSGWVFNNDGDRLKLLTVEKWGNLDLGSYGYNFYGCANLMINANDTLKYVTNLHYTFRQCVNLNDNFNIDTSLVTDFYGMFYGCTNFNKNLNLNLNLANDIRYLYRSCTNFNQPFNYTLPSTIVNLFALFSYCTSFNQDISNISLKYIENMDYILGSATSWSQANYDLFLLGAYNQAITTGVKTNVTFRCITKYTGGGPVEAARTYLSTTKLWTIIDGGVA